MGTYGQEEMRVNKDIMLLSFGMPLIFLVASFIADMGAYTNHPVLLFGVNAAIYFELGAAALSGLPFYALSNMRTSIAISIAMAVVWEIGVSIEIHNQAVIVGNYPILAILTVIIIGMAVGIFGVVVKICIGKRSSS